MSSRTIRVFGALLLAQAAPAAAQEASGCWSGTIGADRGVIEVARAGTGWRGAIHRFRDVVRSDSISAISVEGNLLRLSYPSGRDAGEVSFTGTIVGSELRGTARSPGNEVPVTLARIDPAAPEPATELIGYWRGGIEQAGVLVLRLGVEFAPAPCGQVIATMDSPDQGVENIPISSLAVAGDSIAFAVAAISGTFRGTVDPGGTKIAGTWSQGPNTLGMSLARSDGGDSFVRPQHPRAPFPYTTVDVSYENEVDGVRLAGTLTLPAGSGPVPAALLLSGSGAQDRDGTLMGHKPFLVLADHLTRRGIAVLRVDDRGIGGSSGSVFAATIADNVRDAAAGVHLLSEHPRIDPRRIGVIGHSEGGWVAAALAAGAENVAFVVMLAGPAVSPYDLLLAQGRVMLEAAGEPLIDERMALTRRMLDVIRMEPDDDRALAALRSAMDEWLGSLPGEAGAEFRTRASGEQYQAQLAQTLRSQTTPWFRGLLAYDPAPALAALNAPVLALFGARDLQVPADQSVPVLEAAWAEHPDATVEVLAELNHLFQHARTGLPSEYARIEETFAPLALERIAAWIERRFVR